MKIIEEKHFLVKGFGFLFYKAEDETNEKFNSLIFVLKHKIPLMISFSPNGWVDRKKDKKLKFTIKNKTLFLSKLAIRF